MFEQLQDRFSTLLRTVRGLGKITEKNVATTGREIRRILLEADVNYRVARDFVDAVVKRAEGSLVLKSVAPGQQFVKIIHEELTRLLGEVLEPIRFADSPPTIVLMAGLHGSGKTTTAAKLAYHFKNEVKKPYLVAGDVYRPAAVEQLRILGEQINVPVWWEDYRDPVKICLNGIENGRSEGCDVIILDTAGRLHVDSEMMGEIVEIAQLTKPHEILFVADGMTGQDAVNSSETFSAALDITGTILTKMDGDARGGAAVSIRAITGKPIKFIGTHEKLDGLQRFYPERMASRILGMGDVLTLVEKAEKVVDSQKAEEMAEKLRKQQFTLEDLQLQLRQMREIGSLEELAGMLPGVGKMATTMMFDDRQLIWTDAIIDSMTPEERQNPSMIDGSRRRRIALGSGRSVQEVNRLLKEFGQLQKMMKGLTKARMNKKIMGQFFGALR